MSSRFFYTIYEGGHMQEWPVGVPIPTFEDLDRKIVHGHGMTRYVLVFNPIVGDYLHVHSLLTPSGRVWDVTLAECDRKWGSTLNNRRWNPASRV